MSTTPSQETLAALRGIQTEIRAGKVMLPKTEQERTWNNAHDRALSIVANYIEGLGLFQITARMEKK